jgi:2-aminoadipate transaminase
MPYVEALPNEDVMAVVRDVIVELGPTALQYGGGQGQLALRERLAMLMAEEGLTADPDDIVVTTGAQQALDLIGKIFIDPGDLIAVEAPAYVGALTAFGAYEPRYLTVDLDDDGMVVDQLEHELVHGQRPKFVYTVPNFANPAGVTMSLERRERLVMLCREAGIPIVEDNPYGLLRFEGAPLPSLKALDPHNVIYLGTVSKTFSPGVRVGWALAEQSVIQRLVLAKEAADLCGSNLTMLVTERWFADDQRWRRNLATLVDTYRARRNAMLEAIEEHFPDGALWTVPAGGFYVWVTLPSWFDTRAMLAAAVERRVAYVPGTAFYPDGRGANQMRLAFCYPNEDRIREGVARLGALLADEEQLYRSLHLP